MNYIRVFKQKNWLNIYKDVIHFNLNKTKYVLRKVIYNSYKEIFNK